MFRYLVESIHGKLGEVFLVKKWSKHQIHAIDSQYLRDDAWADSASEYWRC